MLASPLVPVGLVWGGYPHQIVHGLFPKKASGGSSGTLAHMGKKRGVRVHLKSSPRLGWVMLSQLFFATPRGLGGAKSH